MPLSPTRQENKFFGDIVSAIKLGKTDAISTLIRNNGHIWPEAAKHSYVVYGYDDNQTDYGTCLHIAITWEKMEEEYGHTEYSENTSGRELWIVDRTNDRRSQRPHIVKLFLQNGAHPDQKDFAAAEKLAQKDGERQQVATLLHAYTKTHREESFGRLVAAATEAKTTLPKADPAADLAVVQCAVQNGIWSPVQPEDKKGFDFLEYCWGIQRGLTGGRLTEFEVNAKDPHAAAALLPLGNTLASPVKSNFHHLKVDGDLLAAKKDDQLATGMGAVLRTATTLSITHGNLDAAADNLDAVGKAAGDKRAVHTLHCNQVQTTPAGLERALTALSTNPRAVTVITRDAKGVTSCSAKTTAGASKGEVSSLTIKGGGTSCADVNAFIALSAPQRLALTDGACTADMRDLQLDAKTTALDLSSNTIDDATMPGVVRAISTPTVTELRLNNLKLPSDEKTRDAMAGTIASRRNTLTHLELKNTGLGDKQLRQLTDGLLKGNSTLQSVDLSGNNFSKDALDALATTMLHTNCVTTLEGFTPQQLADSPNLKAVCDRNRNRAKHEADLQSVNQGPEKQAAAFVDQKSSRAALELAQKSLNEGYALSERLVAVNHPNPTTAAELKQRYLEQLHRLPGMWLSAGTRQTNDADKTACYENALQAIKALPVGEQSRLYQQLIGQLIGDRPSLRSCELALQIAKQHLASDSTYIADCHQVYITQLDQAIAAASTFDDAVTLVPKITTLLRELRDPAAVQACRTFLITIGNKYQGTCQSGAALGSLIRSLTAISTSDSENCLRHIEARSRGQALLQTIASELKTDPAKLETHATYKDSQSLKKLVADIKTMPSDPMKSISDIRTFVRAQGLGITSHAPRSLVAAMTKCAGELAAKAAENKANAARTTVPTATPVHPTAATAGAAVADVTNYHLTAASAVPAGGVVVRPPIVAVIPPASTAAAAAATSTASATATAAPSVSAAGSAALPKQQR
jgi:hypothetical protein